MVPLQRLDLATPQLEEPRSDCSDLLQIQRAFQRLSKNYRVHLPAVRGTIGDFQIMSSSGRNVLVDLRLGYCRWSDASHFEHESAAH